MTVRRRVGPGDFAAGVPLPCELFNAAGQRVLRTGEIVEAGSAWQALLEQGLYMSLDMLHRLEPTSVQQCIARAVEMLERLYAQPLERSPIGPGVMQAVRLVQAAWQRSPRVMLATVMLCREQVSPARHAVHSACFTQVVMKSMGVDERIRPSVLAAALTLHLGEAQQVAQGDAATVVQVAATGEGMRQYLQCLGVTDTLWLELVEKSQLATSIEYRQKAPDNTALVAQLIALADLYTGRIVNAENKHFGNSRVVLRELLTERGQHFDALLASHFIRALGIYPVGSVVALRNGETGVVCEPSDQVDAPWVYCLFGPLGSRLPAGVRRDTREPIYGISASLAPGALQDTVDMQAIWGDEAGEYCPVGAKGE